MNYLQGRIKLSHGPKVAQRLDVPQLSDLRGLNYLNTHNPSLLEWENLYDILNTKYTSQFCKPYGVKSLQTYFLTLVDEVESLSSFWPDCGKLDGDLVSRTQRKRLT